MASVGGISVSAWRGTLNGPRATVDVVTRPGIAGTGFLASAASAQESQVATDALHVSLAAAAASRDACLALIGMVVTVIDALGTTWTDVLVVDCQADVRAIAGVAGNAALLSCRWRLIAED